MDKKEKSMIEDIYRALDDFLGRAQWTSPWGRHYLSGDLVEAFAFADAATLGDCIDFLYDTFPEGGIRK